MKKMNTFVRPDEHFDEDLCKVMGEHYVGEEIPVAAEFEQVKESCNGILEAVKWPALFAALIVFMAWASNAGLMDPVIAIPGMCVCSGCAGYQLHK
jgi:hypothetical protein